MMIKMHSAGGIIINELNEVAIVFTNTKSWQFPKGGIEPGETHAETAIREIQEETGLKDITLVKELPEYSRLSTLAKDTRLHIYYFLFRTKKQKLVPSAEISQCKWVAIDKAKDELTYPKDKKFIMAVKQSILDTINSKHLK
jgi:mutator protein MutT